VSSQHVPARFDATGPSFSAALTPGAGDPRPCQATEIPPPGSMSGQEHLDMVWTRLWTPTGPMGD